MTRSATGHQASCSMTSSPMRGANGVPAVAIAEQRGQVAEMVASRRSARSRRRRGGMSGVMAGTR